MTKYKVTAILCTLLFVWVGGTYDAVAEEVEKEEPTIELCENVYFQPSGVNNYGIIHIRGKLLGYTLVRELAVAVYGIEGVASVTPYPYSMSISKGEMYSWKEIFKDMAVIVQRVRAEAAKRAKNDKTGL